MDSTTTLDSGLRTPQVYSLLESPSPNVEPPRLLSVEDRILACYDACNERLDAGVPTEAIENLATGLSALRSESSPAEWRQAARTSRAHPTHRRLLEDPYMWSAFHKPRGYPGDAHTMDFVYGFRSADSAVTPLGHELLQISTAVPIADAVRRRCAHIAEAIRKTVERVNDASIVSIACGHMRELHRLSTRETAGSSIVGVDHDGVTLEELLRLHPGRPLRPVRGSVRDMISKQLTIPDADLIYVAGLYDYLEDRPAIALSRVLSERLRPGGVLLILNLSPANIEIACMEAVWDWWLTYRDGQQMRALARAVGGGELTAETYDIAAGRVACLSLRR